MSYLWSKTVSIIHNCFHDAFHATPFVKQLIKNKLRSDAFIMFQFFDEKILAAEVCMLEKVVNMPKQPPVLQQCYEKILNSARQEYEVTKARIPYAPIPVYDELPSVSRYVNFLEQPLHGHGDILGRITPCILLFDLLGKEIRQHPEHEFQDWAMSIISSTEHTTLIDALEFFSMHFPEQHPLFLKQIQQASQHEIDFFQELSARLESHVPSMQKN